MNDTTKAPILSKESLHIVNALYSAKSGNDVFYALSEVASDNLIIMHEMIEYIITERELLKDARELIKDAKK